MASDMPERTDERTVFSLSEVAGSIRKTLAERYTSSFWIKAEMNKLNLYPQSGHCYPDLVEKKEGKIVAEMRSTIWKDDFRRINDNFLRVLHEPLKDGISVLLSAKITFSPVYGLSLTILDIDPSYSLGELEKEKQATIARLRAEGVFLLNRSLQLALLPKRIAVISVETSKGYADFVKIIDNNEWGYALFHMLFPALLQGDQAVSSIMYQLERIRKVRRHFDAVAIIRGGGGDIGLTCYNAFELARAIALFPIPVITGIGHSTNDTVSEMVACRNAITPTELADFLIQRFHNFSVPVTTAREVIVAESRRILRQEQSAVMNTARIFRSVTSSALQTGNHSVGKLVRSLRHQTTSLIRWANERHIVRSREAILAGAAQLARINRQRIGFAGTSLAASSGNRLREQAQAIANLETSTRLLDPMRVLSRGYSITRCNGKALRSVSEVEPGALLTTQLPDGTFISVAKEISNISNDERT